MCETRAEPAQRQARQIGQEKLRFENVILIMDGGGKRYHSTLDRCSRTHSKPVPEPKTSLLLFQNFNHSLLYWRKGGENGMMKNGRWWQSPKQTTSVSKERASRQQGTLRLPLQHVKMRSSSSEDGLVCYYIVDIHSRGWYAQHRGLYIHIHTQAHPIEHC